MKSRLNEWLPLRRLLACPWNKRRQRGWRPAVNPTVKRFAAQKIALPLEVKPANFTVVARQGTITK
jgi:hypothetical protein